MHGPKKKKKKDEKKVIKGEDRDWSATMLIAVETNIIYAQQCRVQKQSLRVVNVESGYLIMLLNMSLDKPPCP